MSGWRLGRLKEEWVVRIDGSRYRTGVPFGADTEPQARAQAEKIARQHRDHYNDQPETCAEIMRAYIVDAQIRENAVNSPDNLNYAAKAVLPFYGSLKPEECTREACREYIKIARKAGKADSTIKTQLSYLRAALYWHDKHSPAVFELPSPKPTRDRWLTSDEIKRLRDGAESPHISLFIILALCTAARTEAILGLTWGTHIDFENEEIWLGFKEGGKGRATVPMNPTVKAHLRDAKSCARTEYVIEFNGRSIKSVRKGLKNAYQRAGITDVKQPAHIMRKTAGRILLEAGVSMDLISQILGHSSVKVTESIYARFSPDGMRKAMEKLSFQ